MLDIIDGWRQTECTGMELLLYKTMCKYICSGFSLGSVNPEASVVLHIVFSQQNINVNMIKTAMKTRKYL